jgi:hypothetical protein
MSYHEVALCDTDQPTFIQPLDIRSDACLSSLLSPLRHAHVSLYPLSDIALTSAKPCENHKNDFCRERKMQLQQIVSEVFSLPIITTSNDLGLYGTTDSDAFKEMFPLPFRFCPTGANAI